MDNHTSSLNENTALHGEPSGSATARTARSDIFNLGAQRGERSTDARDGGVSPLEQEVLDEYERLAGNMKRLTTTLSSLTTSTSDQPPALSLEIAEGLRLLERKVASVYTLMKASVYSIVLQQGQEPDGEDGRGSEDG